MMAEIKEATTNFARVLGSASKIVLLMLVGTLCIALFTGQIDAVLFEKAVLLVLGYYFGKTEVSGPKSSM